MENFTYQGSWWHNHHKACSFIFWNHHRRWIWIWIQLAIKNTSMGCFFLFCRFQTIRYPSYSMDHMYSMLLFRSFPVLLLLQSLSCPGETILRYAFMVSPKFGLQTTLRVASFFGLFLTKRMFFTILTA